MGNNCCKIDERPAQSSEISKVEELRKIQQNSPNRISQYGISENNNCLPLTQEQVSAAAVIQKQTKSYLISKIIKQHGPKKGQFVKIEDALPQNVKKILQSYKAKHGSFQDTEIYKNYGTKKRKKF